jgi:hypothetical protein
LHKTWNLPVGFHILSRGHSTCMALQQAQEASLTFLRINCRSNRRQDKSCKRARVRSVKGCVSAPMALSRMRSAAKWTHSTPHCWQYKTSNSSGNSPRIVCLFDWSPKPGSNTSKKRAHSRSNGTKSVVPRNPIMNFD